MLSSVLTLALTLVPTHAITIGKTELPDTWPLANETLVLNGAGSRDYSFLRIQLYAAALYLPRREANADAILQASTPRVMHMKILRDVSRADSVSAWAHYLDANCTAPCDKAAKTFTAALVTFQQGVPETKIGDTQTFIFRDGNVTWFRNDHLLGEIRDSHFARALLASWIGAVPTTPELRRQLLGRP